MKSISLNLRYFYLYDVYYKVIRINNRLRNTAKKLLFKPIYYSYWSVDCDMCECSGVSEFYGTKKAFNKMENNFYMDAEGSCSIDVITKDEFLERENTETFRDRILEAYENGNGTSIYV